MIFKKFVRQIKNLILAFKLISFRNKSTHSMLIELVYQSRLKSHTNPFAAKYAKRYFSQSDEDGITLEILSRIGSESKSSSNLFLEFGVGNGTENNSLVLLSSGYSGTWVGGQDLAINPSASSNLKFIQTWVTLDNIIEIYQNSLKLWSTPQFDMVSMDLDGNDFYFVSSLLDCGCRPKLFICEYNALFPPLCFMVTTIQFSSHLVS